MYLYTFYILYDGTFFSLGRFASNMAFLLAGWLTLYTLAFSTYIYTSSLFFDGKTSLLQTHFEFEMNSEQEGYMEK